MVIDDDQAARGTAWLMLARLVFLGGGLVISIILARGLGPVDFGIYGVIVTLLTLLEGVLGRGVPGAVANLIPKHEGGPPVVEQMARVLVIAGSLVLFGFCWFIAPAAADLFEIPDGAFLFRLASADIPLMAVFIAYQGILYGHQRYGAVSFCLVLQTLIKLAGVVLLTHLGMSVTGALIAHLAATACVMAYLLLSQPPIRAPWSGAVARAILVIALPMCVYSVAMQAHASMALWILKGMGAGADVVGFYAAALNVTRALTVVQSAVTGVLFASLSWAFARADNVAARSQIQESTRFALLLLAPACVLLAIDAHGVIELLYGKDYAAASAILPWQVLGFGALALLDIFFHVLMAQGRFAWCAAILMGLVPAGVVLNLMLIPLWGGPGAAIALLLIAVAGALISAVLAARQFAPLVQHRSLMRIGIATLILNTIAFQVPARGLWLVPKFVVLGAVYLLILTLLREITSKDLKAFMPRHARRR